MISWQEFNESYAYSNDIDKIMSWVFNNISFSDIPDLIHDIESGSISESKFNENIFLDAKDRLSKWFDRKILNYLVNKKSKFYVDLVGKLNIFNISTLQDVAENYRPFNLYSIYLAGGMDKAKDVGAGWRSMIEYEFEINNPGITSDMPEVTIPYSQKLKFAGTTIIKPAYVIDDYNLTKFLDQGNSFAKRYYDSPAILNPVRKEVDRTKNKKFADELDKFKRGEYQDVNDPHVFDEISKSFSKSIEFEDEILVNKCDAVFIGFNESASAGTFGELQQTSLMRKPLFAWYMGDWPISGHSPWNIPHISKIMKTDDDMRTFVKTMVSYKK